MKFHELLLLYALIQLQLNIDKGDSNTNSIRKLIYELFSVKQGNKLQLQKL